jgi:hypothetical protein
MSIGITAGRKSQLGAMFSVVIAAGWKYYKTQGQILEPRLHCMRMLGLRLRPGRALTVSLYQRLAVISVARTEPLMDLNNVI